MVSGFPNSSPFSPLPANPNGTSQPPGPTSQPRFLSSQNPAQIKRNVLASFTSVLLLPVTIVPRAVGTVGDAIVTGGKSLRMLNPAKWGGVSGAEVERVSKIGWGPSANVNGNESGAAGGIYSKGELGEGKDNGSTVFEVGEGEEGEDTAEEEMKGPAVVNEWSAAEEKRPRGGDDDGQLRSPSG